MEKIELYKILTIGSEDGGEDKDYTVANMLEYQDATYLYLIEVDKDENIIENNQMIVRLVINNGEESVERVTDEKEHQKVARLFYEMFKEMADKASEKTAE